MLAADAAAMAPLPSFDNSSMDGYAVHAADIAAATAEAPVTLPVTDQIPAGDTRALTVAPGTCVRIMTGALFPAGADAVVPVELTDGGADRARFSRAVVKGYSIRRRGDDVAEGDVLLPAGARLGPAQIALLAASGHGSVLARAMPRVAVLATGNELSEPGSPLVPGQIWESNSYMLAAAVRQAGGSATRHRAGDDPEKVLALIGELSTQADLLITSGGVSMGGEHDVVKAALSGSGLGTITFRKVALQPGMPQGFGVVGPDQTPILTLPGNPVSAFVSFWLFGRPALDALQGLAPQPAPARPGAARRPGALPAGPPVLPARRARRGRGHGDPADQPGLASARRAGPGQRPDRGAGRGGLVGRRRGSRRNLAAMTQAGLSHLDESGHARMVDVSAKDVTAREARASGRVLLSAAAIAALRSGQVPKGDALAVARIAGIQGAKRTPDLVPLCHPIAIHSVTVDLEVTGEAVLIEATVRTADRTGVEMEALTSVTVAALALIDMVKAIDPAAVISDVRVEEKTGGKTGPWRRP